MSWRLMDAVLDLRLPDEQERILVRLARYASDDGSRCFPGVAQLAAESGRSERSVQRVLRVLESNGQIVTVAHKHGGRGRTTEFRLTVKGDTDDALYDPERVTPVVVKGDTHDTLSEDKRVTCVSPFEVERVTPVVERVTPVTVKGDTGVTPIDHEEITGRDQPTAAAAKKPTLSDLSDDARGVLDDWRRKQGKTRAPSLNPVLARELEDAVLDLGVARLVEANTWAAKEGVTALVKAIRAARTQRKRQESGSPQLPGFRAVTPSKNGTAAAPSQSPTTLPAKSRTYHIRGVPDAGS